MRSFLLLASVLASSVALYEEPPGGCQGPPDDFIPPPKQQPKQLYAEPAGGCKGPPDDFEQPAQVKRASDSPTPKKKEALDDDAATLEKELYEQEASDMMALPEGGTGCLLAHCTAHRDDRT